MKDRKRMKRDLSGGLFMVEGYSELLEYARFRPQALKKVVCKEKHLEQAKQITATLSIKPEIWEQWNALQPGDVKGDAPIFGFVELSYESEDELLSHAEASKNEMILALDHITDPRNLGAIARTAAFFGVKKILIPKDRQVLLTQASVSTSKGGFAVSDLVLVTNISRTMEKLKKLDYWVLASDMEGKPFTTMTTKFEKIVLVLGAEGKGVSGLVKKRSDEIITIAPNGETIDSLNVSVAAGILIQRFAQPHA